MENVTSTNSNQLDAVVGTFAGGQEVGTTALWGFLGPSPRDSYRLYTDVSFGRFYEIPQDAVVRMDDDDEETGGTTVHVTPSAEIRLNETSTMTPVSAFLEGSITAAYLPQQSDAQWYAAANAQGPATMGCIAPTANCAAGGGGGGAGGGGFCITVYTAVPTWCKPPGGGDDPKCTQVTETFVCTLDPPQVAGKAGGDDFCAIVFATTFCTKNAAPQANDAGCAGIRDTQLCTFDAKAAEGGAAAAVTNCAHILKTLVCTIPVNVTTCLPFTTCFMVLGTTTCTNVPKTGPVCLTFDTARPTNCDPPCAKVLNTILCTFDVANEKALAAAAPGGDVCTQVLGTVICTHGGGGGGSKRAAKDEAAQPAGIPCLIVMTTVHCTFDVQQQQQICLQYVTANPTMCEPPKPPCPVILTTLVCTLPRPRGVAEDAQCREGQLTVACTYEGQPGAEALWTRHCEQAAFAPTPSAVTKCTACGGADAMQFTFGTCTLQTPPGCRVLFTPATLCTQTAHCGLADAAGGGDAERMPYTRRTCTDLCAMKYTWLGCDDPTTGCMAAGAVGTFGPCTGAIPPGCQVHASAATTCTQTPRCGAAAFQPTEGPCTGVRPGTAATVCTQTVVPFTQTLCTLQIPPGCHIVATPATTCTQTGHCGVGAGGGGGGGGADAMPATWNQCSMLGGCTRLPDFAGGGGAVGCQVHASAATTCTQTPQCGAADRMPYTRTTCTDAPTNYCPPGAMPATWNQCSMLGGCTKLPDFAAGGGAADYGGGTCACPSFGVVCTAFCTTRGGGGS